MEESTQKKPMNVSLCNAKKRKSKLWRKEASSALHFSRRVLARVGGTREFVGGF